MSNVPKTLLIGLAFACAAVSLSHAGEAVTRLAFYDAHGARIGEGEFVLSDLLEGRTDEGKWRFKLAAGYKKPREDVVSASDMLNKPDWQKLCSDATAKDKMFINLHPAAPTDWVFLTLPAAQEPVRSGSWVYRTDGGIVEKGSFSSPN